MFSKDLNLISCQEAHDRNGFIKNMTLGIYTNKNQVPPGIKQTNKQKMAKAIPQLEQKEKTRTGTRQ